MSRNFDFKDDYCRISLPESEWTHIDRWFGTNVSLTSMVLTEWDKIKKTIEKGPRKIIWLGIPSIDVMINGISPGETLYIGHADEKSNMVFSLNLVSKFGIEAKKKILVFNSGRGEYAYARGLISLQAGIDEFKLRVGEQLLEEEIESIEKAVDDIRLSDISFVNTPSVYVETICDEVYQLKPEDKPELIFIDNLRFLTTYKKCKNKSKEYRFVSKKLWELAKDTKIPIVVTGPLSKNRRTMKDYWPTASDMPAENMLDNFDKILMIHPSTDKKDLNVFNITTVKNPDGCYGYRKIRYIPEFNKLEEILRQG